MSTIDNTRITTDGTGTLYSVESPLTSSPIVTANAVEVVNGPPGPTGPEGPQGPAGISIANAYTNAFDNLFLTFTDNSVVNVGLLPKGPTGPNGIQGPEGPAGATGPDGPSGPIGPIGPQGVQGLLGPIGPVGPSGPQGNAGPAGSQGPQGIAGVSIINAGINSNDHLILNLSNSNQIDAGLLPKGPQGPIGPQGASITNAVINQSAHLILTLSNSTQIDTGAVPTLGAPGPQGIQGIQGPSGPKGDTGLQGQVGAAGANGLKGDTGPSGPAGPQGLIGPIGPKGDTGAIGPQGAQGAQGIQGIQGVQGVTGISVTGARINDSSHLILNLSNSSQIDAGSVAVTSADVSHIALGTGATATTVQSKLNQIISVKDYGAKGDGETDDTVAIQLADTAAASSEKSLYFPSGKYKVSSQIIRTANSWVGNGHTSILKSTTKTFAVNTAMVSMTNIENATTENITFDFNGSTGVSIAAAAILTFGCSYGSYINCRFLNISTNLIGIAFVARSSYNLISGCYFHDPVPDNIYNQAVNISNSGGESIHNTIEKCTLRGTGIFSNGSYTSVYGCHGFGGTQFGSHCAFGPELGQIGCQAIDNIFVDGGKNIDVNDTYISGIENWASYSIIKGNYCGNNGGIGISNGGGYTIISGNICINNGQNSGTTASAGIVQYKISNPINSDPSNTIISSNIIKDTQNPATQVVGYGEYSIDGSNAFNISIIDNFIDGTNITKYALDTKFVGHTIKSRQSTGKNSVSPGTISANETYIGSIFVAGARVGDSVKIGYSALLSGVIVYGEVPSDNIVNFTFKNLTTGSVTIAPSTIYATAEEIIA